VVSGQVRPSGHLQVVDRGGGRRWHAMWRDADGRHQKILGPAWVKRQRQAHGARRDRLARRQRPQARPVLPSYASRSRRPAAVDPRSAARGDQGGTSDRAAVRGGGGRVARARRAKAPPEVLHAQGLPLPHQHPPHPNVRRARAPRHHPPARRTLACRLRAHPHRRQGPHGPRRDSALRPAPRAHRRQPDRRRRGPPRPLLRRLRHLRPRGDR
jgi:hypothetical protein